MPTLYHFPPSPYSLRARLALEEKGVAWESRVIDIIARRENYAPWYVRLHPGCVVPLLVDGEHTIAESDAIVAFIEEHYAGPKLIPDEGRARERMQTWVDHARSFPLERVHASLANRTMSRVEGRAFDGRIAHLRRLSKANPDLADRYAVKIADMEKKQGFVCAPEPRETMLEVVDGELRALDEALRESPFLAGPSYSLAEVYWTPIIGRLGIIGVLDRIQRFPAVTRWWSSLHARPSFRRADVWERLKPWVLAPYLLRAYAVTLLLALLVLAAIVFVAVRVLR